MCTQKQLNALAERRRLLALEADLHRSLILLERERLRSKLDWIHQARESVAAGGPWIAAGGAVAGLLAARHWRKLAKWIPAGLTALRWVKSLKRK